MIILVVGIGWDGTLISGRSWLFVMASKSIVEAVREEKEPALRRGLKCFTRRWVGRINRNSWVGTRSNVGQWTVNGRSMDGQWWQ
jgi:hypothetical protein